MTQAIDSSFTDIAGEGFGADVERVGVEDTADVNYPEEKSAPPTPVRWTGAMPASSYGVMAVVNDDGYLVPLWTANDLLRACRIYWHSVND
jgi:hypothetical protein